MNKLIRALLIAALLTIPTYSPQPVWATNTTATQMMLGQARTISGTITATGTTTSTIFALPNHSGENWAQITIQSVNDTVTTFTADLEVDLSGNDSNFVPLYAGLDLKNTPSIPINLNGGNARYRLNVKTWTGTGAVVWAIVG